MAIPRGTITLLFTDIEGSTKLWEGHPEAMQTVLARHDALLREAIEAHTGFVFKTIGDAFCAAFATAPEAAQAALDAQLALALEVWPEPLTLKVRMALHTGAVESRDRDYFGPPLNRVARLLSTGHGGQTLLTQATQELVRDSLPPTATLRDLGTHQLKDLARPEQIYQLQHPSLAESFPALKSLSTHPNNLPQQVTSFIGREKELAEVQERLAQTRLLTLTGAGGSGKSRLSLQAAADLLERFPDGAFLVELAPLADPDLVVQTVAGALGLKEETGLPILNTLVESLKNKQLLLLLDNCEHVLDASAKLADALIRSCPDLKILATSREGLGIAGESTYRVPSLSLPDPKQTQTAETLSHFEAVRLFIDRALQTQPTFAVTNENAPALASICFRLDGIPLAIELAAARARSLSVEEINTKLDQRFRLLTGGSRTALPRQQTLRSLIDWSYALLTAQEKQVLESLSVFAGGWTLEAAEAVCVSDTVEDWEVLDLLTSLVDKSLVLAEQKHGHTRYRMLETIRQYSRDRLLDRGTGSAVREKHLDYFLALAKEAEPKVRGAEQNKWLNTLEEEHENLRLSLEWALQDEGGEKASALSLSLADFWVLRGYHAEGREWLEQALAKPHAQPRTQCRARLLMNVGDFAWYQADNRIAQAHFEECLELARELGDKRIIAYALRGTVANTTSYATKRTHYEDSLALFREVGDTYETFMALLYLGGLELADGNLLRVKEIANECLALSHVLGSPALIASAFTQMGNVAKREGNLQQARTYHEESLRLRREGSEKHLMAISLEHLGMIALEQQDYPNAMVYFEENLRLQTELGGRTKGMRGKSFLGMVAFCQGDYAGARSIYEESLALAREMDNVTGRASTAFSACALGHVACFQGDDSTAHACFHESLAICQEYLQERRLCLSYVLTGFGLLALSAHDILCAACLWGAGAKLREGIDSPMTLAPQNQLEMKYAAARAVLNDDTAFDAAWQEGRALTLEQAIALARETSS